MSQVPPAFLEVRTATGQGLRVEFVRVKDRYAHVISLLDGARAVPAWQSVEGTDADDWPPSPPLQQFSLETLPDGRRVALLVGMAGTSHWSMSVEPAHDGAAFVFDVACRVKQRPDVLGSTYRREHELSNDVPIQPASADDGVDGSDSVLTIAPEPSNSLNRFPGTVRWKYRVGE